MARGKSEPSSSSCRKLHCVAVSASKTMGAAIATMISNSDTLMVLVILRAYGLGVDPKKLQYQLAAYHSTRQPGSSPEIRRRDSQSHTFRILSRKG